MLLSREAGIAYSSTAVDWVNFVRDIFVEVVYREYLQKKLRGEIEIDEALFGTKVKYHHGQPRGRRIWIFGSIERVTNKLVSVPVNSRDENTLVRITRKFVETG
ncbi:hypothetical protein ElyMa_003316500 [Elysia marginata]|uniref:ISXO2-like transposase domain-containing protein n=1 Tax=Elysia marginata TaxID=1093978 RepID=A0AAV4JEW8_9GAST|nr:hypothetical protein ElyMa_003316500 [Elysia marginata]